MIETTYTVKVQRASMDDDPLITVTHQGRKIDTRKIRTVGNRISFVGLLINPETPLLPVHEG